MLERLKICWYALTKKQYAFYAIDNNEIGKHNGVCFIEEKAEHNRAFLETIIEVTDSINKEYNTQNDLQHR